MDEVTLHSDAQAWIPARIVAIDDLTPGIKRIVLRPHEWRRPRPGQHVDVRLTAEDGYQTHRSYSVLSPPGHHGVYELAVERIEGGEVSPYFHDTAQLGDDVEVFGPVGGHFIWDGRSPALLIGGGSGLVPLLAMAAHRVETVATDPMVLIAATRTSADVPLLGSMLGWEERGNGFTVLFAHSRLAVPFRSQDRAGRIDTELIQRGLSLLAFPQSEFICYICGSNAFVDSVVSMLLSLDVSSGSIRTERFGE